MAESRASSKLSGVEKLQERVQLLEEAATADDQLAILESFSAWCTTLTTRWLEGIESAQESDQRDPSPLFFSPLFSPPLYEIPFMKFGQSKGPVPLYKFFVALTSSLHLAPRLRIRFTHFFFNPIFLCFFAYF